MIIEQCWLHNSFVIALQPNISNLSFKSINDSLLRASNTVFGLQMVKFDFQVLQKLLPLK